MKNFPLWCKRKESLHEQTHKAPLVKERDIWWASVGENVGSEINGKSDQFSRPVIILKKFSHGFYLAIPTTTQVKSGSWFSPFTHRTIKMVACLHQVRALDYRRLSSRIGQLDSTDFKKIKDDFHRLLQ